MPAPDSVLKLVETFQAHREHYKSSAYNETQLRREFLDPFFKALGWDIDNEQGYADAYKDVIHEDAIKIGGFTKAPDYCFRIGGTRKFFLEAKKPSIQIKTDCGPAYQLRRYAWSAKLPLSILSDFEEFAIYDCRVQPLKNDPPSKARTFYTTFDRYQEHWDEIAAIFSRDAILKGSFDKYATSTKKKRGTAEVDDAFLAEIERWRDLLARNLALRNPQLSVRDLNFAVQKTIDRLIFLRICEDRGTEDYGRLAKLRNGTNCYPRLLEEFQRADDRYNSGLFHFSREKGRPGEPDALTPALQLDDKVVKDIVQHLYYPDSPYEFSVLPADILGQVYERFLGKTIRLTSSHQARIEEKPEVRKAGGVYYTPSYIVDYIVENTLGRLLNGPDPAAPKPVPVSQAEKIKVLDPACGSGSFLIVAYQYLLDWHRDQYTLDPATGLPDEGKLRRHSAGKSPKIYQGKGGEWRLTTAERKRILLANIHGVDIDTQAVEVTKLSLLLKVLEGETEQQLQRDFLKERQRILPDLGHNIRCGNSLIGPDFYDQPDLPELDDETRYRINVFDWNEAFPEIMRNGGFDCVIGNPPYDVLEKDRKKASWPHSCLSDYSKTTASLAGALGGKLNLFRFFLVKSNQLLRASGRLGMITPLSIIADVSCSRTRKSFVEALSQLTADCFPQKDNRARRVFRDAKLSTVVLIGTRSTTRTENPAIELRIYPGRRFDEAHIENHVSLADLEMIDAKNVPVPICDSESWKMLVDLHRRAEISRFGDLPEFLVRRGEINQTIYREFITPDPTKARLVKGVEIGQYFTRSKLSQGEREWFDLDAFVKTRTVPEEFHSPRIALQRITGIDERLRVVGAPISPPALFADSTNSLRLSVTAKHSLNYALGILNSRLIQWAFKIFSTNNNVGTNELEILPFRSINFENPADVERHDKMVSLVDRMLDLHRRQAEESNPDTLRHLKTEIAATDRRIDRLVYDLYGLTEEEIALIEDAAG